MRATTDYTILRIWQRIWIACLTKDAEALEAARAEYMAWHQKSTRDPEWLEFVAARLRFVLGKTSPQQQRASLARIRETLAQAPLTPKQMTAAPKAGARKRRQPHEHALREHATARRLPARA